MFKRIIRMSSLVLVMAMLINILPVNVLAASIQTQTGTSNITDKADVNTEAVYILDEVIQNRTEYSKEFRMSNGLKMATLYAQAIHYEDNGEWKEIDNTLKISGTGKNAAFTNTAGPWTVSFPQQMSADHGVTITKDGYTLSFAMSGELHTYSYSRKNSATATPTTTMEMSRASRIFRIRLQPTSIPTII